MVDQSIQVTDPGLPSVFTVRETKIIGKAMNLIEGKVLRERPILNCAEAVERYLMLRFAGLTHEQFHVLYIDNRCRLIAAIAEFFGQPSDVKTDVRRIVLHALTLGAGHVAFAHNHPSDSAFPSEGDIQHMDAYENILSQLDIHLLDSFIVTSRGIISTKAVCKRRADEESRKLKFERDRRRAVRRSKIASAKAQTRAHPEGGDILIDQYNAIKAENPGSLLFYRMGDFYELFFDDAEITAKALGIVLTKRGKHEGRSIPMCGVPVERAEDCLNLLIGQGHRVAVCEQIEDVAEARKRGAKSVVRREVVRTVTPSVSDSCGLETPALKKLRADAEAARDKLDQIALDAFGEDEIARICGIDRHVRQNASLVFIYIARKDWPPGAQAAWDARAAAMKAFEAYGHDPDPTKEINRHEDRRHPLR